MKKLNIPVGISEFDKIRDRGYYYVDKTNLIAELLDNIAEVTLITRPRRFGKTMAMSMLANFFDMQQDNIERFCGLKISQNTELCSQWMNQWPVLFLSFKEVDGTVFDHAFLAGIFAGAGYEVDSNKEHGEGRSDVVVYDPINACVAIFEAKYTKTLGNLEKDCDTALQQIDDRMYAKEYEDDYDKILCYGISFFKKRCMVKGKG